MTDDGERGVAIGWLLPGAIFVVAFALRAWKPGLVHFGIDEGKAAAVAMQIAHGVRFPLTGIETSFGFHNPPLFLYLIAPFFALSRNPVVALMAFHLAGSLAVLAAWRCGSILGERRCAVAAAVIVAVCPNAVEHSRRLWGHDLIVPFSALCLWGALEAARRRDWRWLVVSFAGATAAQSVHLSGVALWVPALFAASRCCIPRAWIGIAIGFAILGLSYLPWLVNECQSGFPDSAIIGSLLSGSYRVPEIGHPVNPGAAWATVLSDFWSHDLAGSKRPWMLSPLAAVASFFASACAMLLLGAGVFFSMRLAGKKDCVAGSGVSGAAVMLLLGIAVPLLMFAVVFRSSVPPYMLPALFPAALAAAWALSAWRSRRAAAGCLFVYTVASLLLVLEVRRQIDAGEGSNLPLGEKRDIAALITAERPPGSIAVMQNARAPGAGLDVALVYLLFERGLEAADYAPPGRAASVFVVVEDAARIRREPAVFLAPYQMAESPHARIYRLDPPANVAWLEVLRQFPAPER